MEKTIRNRPKGLSIALKGAQKLWATQRMPRRSPSRLAASACSSPKPPRPLCAPKSLRLPGLEVLELPVAHANPDQKHEKNVENTWKNDEKWLEIGSERLEIAPASRQILRRQAGRLVPHLRRELAVHADGKPAVSTSQKPRKTDENKQKNA